jgi:hypothetical protein
VINSSGVFFDFWLKKSFEKNNFIATVKMLMGKHEKKSISIKNISTVIIRHISREQKNFFYPNILFTHVKR